MPSQIDEAPRYGAISGMDWIVWDWYDYLWVVGGIEHQYGKIQITGYFLLPKKW